MSDTVRTELHTFPSSKEEALTMLYLQNQDLKGKTPEEIADLYSVTISAIRDEFKAIRVNKHNMS